MRPGSKSSQKQTTIHHHYLNPCPAPPSTPGAVKRNSYAHTGEQWENLAFVISDIPRLASLVTQVNAAHTVQMHQRVA